MKDSMSLSIQRAVEFLSKQWHLPISQPNFVTDPGIILKAVTSGSWRRTKIDEVSLKDTFQKINTALTDDKDLEFSIPFGGYKSWRTESHPHINWADVFAIQYLRRHGARISEYFPGRIKFSLSYCSGILDIVSNMPLEWQNIYIQEMRELIAMFSDSRITFRLFDIASRFENHTKLREVVLKNYDEIQKNWDNIPSFERDKRIGSAERNLVIKGIEDLSNISTNSMQRRIIRSAMLCDALDSLIERREFNKYSTRIQLVYVRGPSPPSIHIGSCDTSANHFSVGTGAVETKPKGCYQRILTEKNLAQIPVSSYAEFGVPKTVAKGFPGLAKGLIMSE